MDKKGNLVWIDMEMDGLDPEKNTVLEIATVITNSNLEVLAEGPAIAIHQEDKILESMDTWNTEHHNSSGLTDRVKKSKYTIRKAEIETIQFIKKYVEPGKSPLCGNSVHQDRRFLVKYMEELNNFLHYRIIDCSSIKELGKLWYPNFPPFTKKAQHTALADIIESIDELKYYRQHFFIKNPSLT